MALAFRLAIRLRTTKSVNSVLLSAVRRLRFFKVFDAEEDWESSSVFDDDFDEDMFRFMVFGLVGVFGFGFSIFCGGTAFGLVVAARFGSGFFLIFCLSGLGCEKIIAV